MKARLPSLMALVVLGAGAGCINLPPTPGPFTAGGATRGTAAAPAPVASPQAVSPAQTASGLRPQQNHLPRLRTTPVVPADSTRTPPPPQPMSPVATRTPQTLDRPDLSQLETQARATTINLAVQQALRVDQSPLSSNVQVEPQGGAIVLRGSVPDEATRMQVEQAARLSTPGGYIDNQIRVEPK